MASLPVVKICCIKSATKARPAVAHGASAQVRPQGFDLCSSLRTNDVRDEAKLAAFSPRCAP